MYDAKPTITIDMAFAYESTNKRFFIFISHGGATPLKTIRHLCVQKSPRRNHALLHSHLPPKDTSTLELSTPHQVRLLTPVPEKELQQTIHCELSLAIHEIQQKEPDFQTNSIDEILYWGDCNLGTLNGETGPQFLMSPTLFAETFALLNIKPSTSIQRILISGDQTNLDIIKPLYDAQRDREEWRKKWIPCSDPTPLCQYTDHFVIKNTGDKEKITALFERWETPIPVSKPRPWLDWLICNKSTPMQKYPMPSAKNIQDQLPAENLDTIEPF